MSAIAKTMISPDAAPAVRGRNGLAPYASVAAAGRGRVREEAPCPTRSPFQRDRDRIIHSTAFRRLTYKTQVFIYHEGDHYRTRLTHTLEVAQIARSLARILRLDEDLAEALALAHDLGHPPFGHAGERALDEALRGFGGFDHNAQSVRIVTGLERKYAEFDGLNLSWETLEGLIKHNGPLTDKSGRPDGHYAGKIIPRTLLRHASRLEIDLAAYASAEAQVAALADDIAYNSHDIDDGLRAGLIKREHLAEVPLVRTFLDEIDAAYGDLEPSRQIYELTRRLITALVTDMADESRRRLGALNPQSSEDIRLAGEPMVAFSAAMTDALDELRFFLLSFVYRHKRIMRIMSGAQQIVHDLFSRYMGDPQILPEDWRDTLPGQDEDKRARHVADFVAGMTDRYALREHRRLFDVTPELR